MFSKDVTVDKILRGKISIIQLKKGFRYGFEAVFLASFVNGYLKKFKRKIKWIKSRIRINYLISRRGKKKGYWKFEVNFKLRKSYVSSRRK